MIKCRLHKHNNPDQNQKHDNRFSVTASVQKSHKVILRSLHQNTAVCCWKNKHFHYYHKLVTRRIIYTKSYIRIRQTFSNKSNFKIFGSNLLLGTGISAIDYKIKIKNTHKIRAFQLVLSTRALHLWRSNIMDKILTLVQCQQLSWIYYSATEMQCWQSARPVCVDFFLFLTMIFLRSRSGLGSATFTSSWAQHAINNNNNE